MTWPADGIPWWWVKLPHIADTYGGISREPFRTLEFVGVCIVEREFMPRDEIWLWSAGKLQRIVNIANIESDASLCVGEMR